MLRSLKYKDIYQLPICYNLKNEIFGDDPNGECTNRIEKMVI